MIILRLLTGLFSPIPILAAWRHQLSIDFLREQVAFLRQKAEEAAGIYSADRRQAALGSLLR